MKLHRDVVVGGVLLVIAVLYFVGARPLPSGQGEPGPAFLPQILSGALTIVGLIILVRGLRTAPALSRESGVAHRRWEPGVAILLTVLYVVSFHLLGFVLSTWLYTLFVALLFRWRPPVVAVAVSVVTTFLIYLLFQIGLGVQLPGGLLEDLLSGFQWERVVFVARGQ